jgi:hypothetical protein
MILCNEELFIALDTGRLMITPQPTQETIEWFGRAAKVYQLRSCRVEECRGG